MKNSVTRAMAKPTPAAAHLVESGRGWIPPGNHLHPILGK